VGLEPERLLLFGPLTDWALVLGFWSGDDFEDRGACGADLVLLRESEFCEDILLCVDSGLDAVRPQVRDSGLDDGTEDLSPVLG
jgi:hypothetical protein